MKKVNGLSTGAFCIRNEEGSLVHAEYFGLREASVLMSEVVAVETGLEYCIHQQWWPVVLETDSLILQKVLKRNTKVSWSILEEVKWISRLRKNVDARVKQILREGNTLAYFLAN